jgi:hypothetical protein
MISEALFCVRCGKEYDIYYSFKDDCEIVSGSCKCSLQKRNTKILDEALKKISEVLNEKHQSSFSKVSIATKTGQ